MRSLKVNSAVPWLVRWAIVLACAFLLVHILVALTPTLWAVGMKLSGRAPGCPWSRIVSLQRDLLSFSDQQESIQPVLRTEEYDAAYGIERIVHPDRNFWIRKTGEQWGGLNLLAYLLTEHEWMASRNPEAVVRSGDIVIDCGAHVGVFTHQALQRGAARVVAIDPDPTQVECLRRNFAAEIALGRVVVVPKGVWSSEGSMTLYVGEQNSGTSSLVFETGRRIQVPVTTIDRIASELNLPRVDIIKFDIEGAEREALQGAAETLRRHKPRILLESYHRDDDLEVLPAMITKLHPEYGLTCGPCEYQTVPNPTLVPHYLFFE